MLTQIYVTLSHSDLIRFLQTSRSKNRLYKLEAPDHRTMMYWLLTLQKKRRQFSKRRTAVETGDMQDAKVGIPEIISTFESHYKVVIFSLNSLTPGRFEQNLD